MEENAGTIDVGLLQFIASAHHQPAGALTAFKKWIDVKMQGSHAAFASSALSEYILKSNKNYKSVREYMRERH